MIRKLDWTRSSIDLGHLIHPSTSRLTENIEVVREIIIEDLGTPVRHLDQRLDARYWNFASSNIQISID